MGTGLASQSVDIVVLAFRGPWDVMEKAWPGQKIQR